DRTTGGTMDAIRGGGTWRIHRDRWLPFVAAALSLGVICTPRFGAGSGETSVTVSIPTVTDPIASTPTDFPFIALGFSVEPPVPDGYVEQGYFFSGRGAITGTPHTG